MSEYLKRVQSENLDSKTNELNKEGFKKQMKELKFNILNENKDLFKNKLAGLNDIPDVKIMMNWFAKDKLAKDPSYKNFLTRKLDNDRNLVGTIQAAAKECIRTMNDKGKTKISKVLSNEIMQGIDNEGVDGIVGPNTLTVFIDIFRRNPENKEKIFSLENFDPSFIKKIYDECVGPTITENDRNKVIDNPEYVIGNNEVVNNVINNGEIIEVIPENESTFSITDKNINSLNYEPIGSIIHPKNIDKNSTITFSEKNDGDWKTGLAVGSEIITKKGIVKINIDGSIDYKYTGKELPENERDSFYLSIFDKTGKSIDSEEIKLNISQKKPIITNENINNNENIEVLNSDISVINVDEIPGVGEKIKTKIVEINGVKSLQCNLVDKNGNDIIGGDFSIGSDNLLDVKKDRYKEVELEGEKYYIQQYADDPKNIRLLTRTERDHEKAVLQKTKESLTLKGLSEGYELYQKKYIPVNQIDAQKSVGQTGVEYLIKGKVEIIETGNTNKIHNIDGTIISSRGGKSNSETRQIEIKSIKGSNNQNTQEGIILGDDGVSVYNITNNKDEQENIDIAAIKNVEKTRENIKKRIKEPTIKNPYEGKNKSSWITDFSAKHPEKSEDVYKNLLKSMNEGDASALGDVKLSDNINVISPKGQTIDQVDPFAEENIYSRDIVVQQGNDIVKLGEVEFGNSGILEIKSLEVKQISALGIDLKPILTVEGKDIKIAFDTDKVYEMFKKIDQLRANITNDVSGEGFDLGDIAQSKKENLNELTTFEIFRKIGDGNEMQGCFKINLRDVELLEKLGSNFTFDNDIIIGVPLDITGVTDLQNHSLLSVDYEKTDKTYVISKKALETKTTKTTEVKKGLFKRKTKIITEEVVDKDNIESLYEVNIKDNKLMSVNKNVDDIANFKPKYPTMEGDASTNTVSSFLGIYKNTFEYQSSYDKETSLLKFVKGNTNKAEIPVKEPTAENTYKQLSYEIKEGNSCSVDSENLFPLLSDKINDLQIAGVSRQEIKDAFDNHMKQTGIIYANKNIMDSYGKEATLTRENVLWIENNDGIKEYFSYKVDPDTKVTTLTKDAALYEKANAIMEKIKTQIEIMKKLNEALFVQDDIKGKNEENFNRAGKAWELTEKSKKDLISMNMNNEQQYTIQSKFNKNNGEEQTINYKIDLNTKNIIPDSFDRKDFSIYENKFSIESMDIVGENIKIKVKQIGDNLIKLEQVSSDSNVGIDMSKYDQNLVKEYDSRSVNDIALNEKTQSMFDALGIDWKNNPEISKYIKYPPFSKGVWLSGKWETREEDVERSRGQISNSLISVKSFRDNNPNIKFNAEDFVSSFMKKYVEDPAYSGPTATLKLEDTNTKLQFYGTFDEMGRLVGLSKEYHDENKRKNKSTKEKTEIDQYKITLNKNRLEDEEVDSGGYGLPQPTANPKITIEKINGSDNSTEKINKADKSTDQAPVEGEKGPKKSREERKLEKQKKKEEKRKSKENSAEDLDKNRTSGGV